jgi:hypothetical protein
MKTIWTGYDPTRHVKPTSALGSRLKKRAGRELPISTMTCTPVRGYTQKTLRSLMLDYSLARYIVGPGRVKNWRWRSGTQNNLLGHDRLGSRLRIHFSIHLLVEQSAGSSRIRARWISTAIANHSWDREALRGNRIARPRISQSQRVGVRGFHLRLDLCNRRTLSGRRRTKGPCAFNSSCHSFRFLLHGASESPEAIWDRRFVTANRPDFP